MVQKQLIDEIVRIICELRDGDVDELARYDLKLDCNVTKEHPWKRLCIENLRRIWIANAISLYAL